MPPKRSSISLIISYPWRGFSSRRRRITYLRSPCSKNRPPPNGPPRVPPKGPPRDFHWRPSNMPPNSLYPPDDSSPNAHRNPGPQSLPCIVNSSFWIYRASETPVSVNDTTGDISFDDKAISDDISESSAIYARPAGHSRFGPKPPNRQS